MDEYISRKAAIAYIREQSEECQKAFEELGGESGIYADAYNDLAEDFYSIPAADVAPVVRCKGCKYSCEDGTGRTCEGYWHELSEFAVSVKDNDFCSHGKPKEGENADDHD